MSSDDLSELALSKDLHSPRCLAKARRFVIFSASIAAEGSLPSRLLQYVASQNGTLRVRSSQNPDAPEQSFFSLSVSTRVQTVPVSSTDFLSHLLTALRSLGLNG